jgi:hypothetical protein
LSLSYEYFTEKLEKTGDEVEDEDEEDYVDSCDNVDDDCDDDDDNNNNNNNNNMPLACLLIFNPVFIFSSHSTISF